MTGPLLDFTTQVSLLRAPKVYGTAYERFIAKVRSDPSGCLIWTGVPDKHGYGQFRDERGRSIGAHRWAMSHSLGRVLAPIENVNHTCDVPLCVNVGHLYVGTQAQNIRDMWARGRAHTYAHTLASLSHCAKGHEYTEANTRITPKGTRSCRACARLTWRRNKERKRG